MKRITGKELDEAAMKIIMLAGDGRNLLSEALKNTFADAARPSVEEKMKQANKKIAEAHHIQTDIIQRTIEDDTQTTTLLFSHAQDTLMTVYSEARMAGYMIEMHHVLSEKFNK